MLKQCVICGKEFKAYHSLQVACSTECSCELRRQHSKNYYRTHREQCLKKAQLKRMEERAAIMEKQAAQIVNLATRKSLTEWANEAAACGLSYGYYRYSVEILGKTFEELKLR